VTQLNFARTEPGDGAGGLSLRRKDRGMLWMFVLSVVWIVLISAQASIQIIQA